MAWEISFKVRFSMRKMVECTQKSAVGAFMTNESYSIHGGYIVKVLSNVGGTRSKEWQGGILRCR